MYNYEMFKYDEVTQTFAKEVTSDENLDYLYISFRQQQPRVLWTYKDKNIFIYGESPTFEFQLFSFPMCSFLTNRTDKF